jgi:nucleoside-diphosphate-sugar epimerase
MKLSPRKQKVLLIFGVSGFVGASFLRYLKKHIPDEDLKVIGVVSGDRLEAFLSFLNATNESDRGLSV